MKNQYMFFNEQAFENFDLAEYIRNDILIPKTNIHIYEFECVETDVCSDDKSRAKKLDELTQRLNTAYTDKFQVINSESSQFFCREIYPFVVSFEIKLRYVLYIARALFENKKTGNQLGKYDFLYCVDKKDQSIEEIDFGKIYEYIFTDQNIQSKINKLNTKKKTKKDWLKEFKSLEEQTIWHNMIGTDYSFIENHFLEIIGYRNDVMHNHLITFAQYEKAKIVLQQANQELDRATKDILLVNKSDYLNNVNIIDVISGFLRALEEASKMAKESTLVSALQAFAQFLGDSAITTEKINEEDRNIDAQEENENA